VTDLREAPSIRDEHLDGRLSWCSLVSAIDQTPRARTGRLEVDGCPQSGPGKGGIDGQ